MDDYERDLVTVHDGRDLLNLGCTAQQTGSDGEDTA